MKLHSIYKLSLVVPLFSTVFVGCGHGGNEKAEPQSDKYYQVKLESLKSRKLASLSPSTILNNLRGEYKNCIGKIDGSPWLLATEIESSNLVVKQKDANCELYVKGLTISNALYNGSSGLLKIGKDFPEVGYEFNSSGEKLYAFIKITPENFSAEPKIHVILSSSSSSSEIKETISTEVQSFTNINFGLKSVPEPKYSLDTTNFKPEIDQDGNALFNGKLRFNSGVSDQKAQSYFIAKGSDSLSNYLEIDAYYKNNILGKSRSQAVNGDVERIDGAILNSVDGANLKIDKKTSHSFKFVFVNTLTEAGHKIHSYQVHTLTIKRN